MRISIRQISVSCSILIGLQALHTEARADSTTTAGTPATARHASKHAATPKTGKTAAPRSASASGLSSSVLGQFTSAPEEVSVTGHSISATGITNHTPGGGLMPAQTAPRSQSGITRDYIAKQSPTANISSLVAELPGVTFSSQDPFGMTGDHISMRGMNETQIGYLFEGAPLADPINYEPYTSMLVDSENLGSVTVSQGAPDLNAPFYNAVGGQITATEMNPAHKMGGFLDVGGGTHSANKEFIRLETGDIGNSGIRGFVSFSHTGYNNFRGPGGMMRYHVDSKFVKEWGDGNSISAIFSYNRQQSTSWREPTKAQWSQYGLGFAYDSKFTTGDANYYKLNQSNINSQLVVLPMHFTLADRLKLHVTPYYVHQFGPSLGGENIPASGGYYGTTQYGTLNPGTGTVTNGSILTVGRDPWDQKTGGLNVSADWNITRSNTFSFGWWYAYTTHTELSDFLPVDANGQGWSANSIKVNGKILSGYDLSFMQQVNTLFIADTQKLLNDKLTLSAGFRVAMVSRQGTNLVPGADPYKMQGNYFEPLPQFSASYQITPKDQIFINGTTSFRAPESVEAYSQIFDPNSSHAVEQPQSLKPEYSIGEELGYRRQGSFYNFSMSLFNINMTNHQVTSTGYIPGENLMVASPINIGGQTSRGVSAEIGFRRWHHFSPYFSGQFLHSTFDNNFNTGTGLLPTAGKIAVASPKFTGAIGLNYDDGTFFGNFQLRYVDTQYTTFMDDEKMPAYLTSDVTLGYRMKSFGRIRHPQIQLNLMNIGDNHYLSGSSYTSNAHTQIQTNGVAVAGSAPTYLVGGNFAAMVSVSTGF
ncbi:TonB-dependent receptor [Acetobacter oeni]|uniref:TonB-dependent receptor n=1 Tax=Acetobacter oeni TaxID=304077 RepID=A0A511XLS6_9PROT|nr:TonB-dependent receptor [Acetobacter oeni]MBB3881841.1 iron complex outermembrane receptor protein [Acetobacter oeni]NHO17832.1 TonB-dependent receptor [Acetobacter oeni]GBR05363.1 TonB-dependent receptor [Acetobacter oeni LMG 21952]GEN63884.1 TonB-dependent receptor [Acetobacter oeni]